MSRSFQPMLSALYLIFIISWCIVQVIHDLNVICEKLADIWSGNYSHPGMTLVFLVCFHKHSTIFWIKKIKKLKVVFHLNVFFVIFNSRMMDCQINKNHIYTVVGIDACRVTFHFKQFLFCRSRFIGLLQS